MAPVIPAPVVVVVPVVVPPAVHGHHPWDAALAASEYRLRIALADARVSQALLVLSARPGTMPTTAAECLEDALAALRGYPPGRPVAVEFPGAFD